MTPTCEKCGGEGRKYQSRYGGNDPDVWDAGECEACEGSGTDYETYRGKCKEMSEALVAADPTLILVRGHYHCPMWGEQTHWWCKKPDGTIVDPTKDQFPSRGIGEYVEFDGTIPCANCGKVIKEEDADIEGNYAFCSYKCHGQFVGVF